MKKEIAIEQFKEFLRKEKAASKFYVNFYSKKNNNFAFLYRKSTIDGYLKECPNSQFISAAFEWETFNQLYYWLTLSFKWKKVLSKIILK